jgi:hypothetical protein
MIPLRRIPIMSLYIPGLDLVLHRPGDVVLRLCPAPTNPCQTLAIDITITGNPPLPTAFLPSRPTNQPISLHQAHLQSRHAKISGRNYSTLSATNLIASINSNDICLLPFTVNHLSGLAFFAHQFLFRPSKSILPAPPPPNWHASVFPHQTAFISYQALLKSTYQFLTPS